MYYLVGTDSYDFDLRAATTSIVIGDRIKLLANNLAAAKTGLSSEDCEAPYQLQGIEGMAHKHQVAVAAVRGLTDA